MAPLAATVQLAAAYVPVIDVPATATVTVYGQLLGTLDARFMLAPDPFTVPVMFPLSGPPGPVAFHVPDSDDPDCAIVIRAGPLPAT